jgi:hypothetical protein
MRTYRNRTACSILAATAIVLPAFAGSIAAEPPAPFSTILCPHEADIVTRMCDDRYVRLARFNLAWPTGADAVQKPVSPERYPETCPKEIRA